ncbi:MAG: transporter substrate-binding domain-containing protein [Deferribacteres bacterium]|nr:transporter substrate-binding domain-containing protein [Deferribacteres bacterium]
MPALVWGADKVKVVGAVYPPFFIKTPSGYRGFDVDLLKIILKKDVEFRVVPFKEALDLVAKGKADMAVGGVYVTPDRAHLFNYTNPYLKTGLVMVVPSSSRAQNEGDLRGKRVCVKISATGEKRALKLKDRMNWKVVRKLSTRECFEAVLKGEADALYNDYYNSVYYINRFYVGRLRILRGMWGPIFFEEARIAFPVAKGREKLLYELNHGIRELKRREMLGYLVSKWFNVPFVNFDRARRCRFFAFGAFLILCVAGCAGFLFYHRRRRQELASFKEYLEVLPAAVLVVERGGKLLFANEKGRELLKGRKLAELIGEIDEMCLVLRDSDNEERSFLRFEVPVGGGFCYLFVEITEFKKLHEESVTLKGTLFSMQKIEGLGKVAYQLAYDFNSVLSEVLSFVEVAMVKLEEKDEAGALKCLERAKRRVIAFSQFARKMLSFAGKPVGEGASVDVNQVIEEAEYVIKSILDKVASVEIELGDVRLARADASALFQILLNLAVNARDAFSELGRPYRENRVKIKTYMVIADEEEVKSFPWARPGKYVVVEFSDNGPGISEILLKKIFTPFFTTKPGSSGIGLFVVYELVKFMKGFIKVKAKEGEGVTFLIYLPVAG